MAKATSRDEPAKPDSADPDARQSNQTGHSDDIAALPATSKGASAGHQSSPAMVAVLAYQLGIRLEFARNEHRHADPDCYLQLERDFTAQDIDFTVNSFKALEQEFNELAGTTKCDARIVS